MHIRHLPCQHDLLVDKKEIPPNHAMFNPSADGSYVYIRANQHSEVDESNFVIIYNEDKKSLHRIESPMNLLKPSANLFKGIEDLRIVVYRDLVWFTGTTTHASYKMTNELLVGHFDKDLKCVEKMSVVDIGTLPVKNVCPFVWKNELHLLDAFLKKIYKVDVDESTGEFVATLVQTIETAHGVDTTAYRGSTSPVHLHGNIWGYVVHDIIFNDDLRLVTRLSYIHHWVEIDMERGMIVFISSPFWCVHWGIEYVSGIRYHKKLNTVELFLGIQDAVPVRVATKLHDLRIGK